MAMKNLVKTLVIWVFDEPMKMLFLLSNDECFHQNDDVLIY